MKHRNSFAWMGVIVLSMGCGTPMLVSDSSVLDAQPEVRVDATQQDDGVDSGRDDVALDAPSVMDVAEDGTRADVGSGQDASVPIRLGNAAIAQRVYALNPATGMLTTQPISTQPTRSIMLVSIARGTWSAAPTPPTDNKGNTFTLIGTTHAYGAWPTSQTGLYQSFPLMGGVNHTFSMAWGDIGGTGDEVTLSAVEVVGATRVADASWVERSASNTLMSASVQTTGPAILLAWWWGSGGVRPMGQSHVAMPGNGFSLIPSASGTRSLSNNGYIQVAVASREVTSAGTYSVTWGTDNEGAQLYLVALQE